jgi:putative addiction module component (TIGR02574 family)
MSWFSTARRQATRSSDCNGELGRLASPPNDRCAILPVVGKAVDVHQLSRDERLELIEQLWDSLSDEERDSLPLTAEQEKELDRRLDALEKEGPVGLSTDELRDQIRRRQS